MTVTSTERPQQRLRAKARLHRRLLVNALADPDEVAQRLPGPLRPHVISDGTVVGCCLLELDSVRPAPLPSATGLRAQAAAHRISVEWDTEDGIEVGVYVAQRVTSSVPAQLAGGRLFPGVQDRARVSVPTSQRRVWDYQGSGVMIHVEAGFDGHGVATDDEVAQACLPAEIGVSPRRNGDLEAARMHLGPGPVEALTLTELRSDFIDSFASAQPTTAYLMADREVTWTRVPVPGSR
ncbi:hypothetical protein ACMYYO_13960 [Dermacoccaceae bacterium W4C1]